MSGVVSSDADASLHHLFPDHYAFECGDSVQNNRISGQVRNDGNCKGTRGTLHQYLFTMQYAIAVLGRRYE